MSRALAPFFALAAFLAAPAALACGPSTPEEIAIFLSIPIAFLAGLQLVGTLGVRLSLGFRFGWVARTGIAVLLAPVIALSWLLCFRVMEELPVVGVGVVALQAGVTLMFGRALSLSWLRRPLA